MVGPKPCGSHVDRFPAAAALRRGRAAFKGQGGKVRSLISLRSVAPPAVSQTAPTSNARGSQGEPQAGGAGWAGAPAAPGALQGPHAGVIQAVGEPGKPRPRCRRPPLPPPPLPPLASSTAAAGCTTPPACLLRCLLPPPPCLQTCLNSCPLGAPPAPNAACAAGAAGRGGLRRRGGCAMPGRGAVPCQPLQQRLWRACPGRRLGQLAVRDHLED